MPTTKITATTVESLLHHLLEPIANEYAKDVTLANAAEEADVAPGTLRRVVTYEEACMMTSDRGLVLKLADGSEFQITIVQRR